MRKHNRSSVACEETGFASSCCASVAVGVLAADPSRPSGGRASPHLPQAPPAERAADHGELPRHSRCDSCRGCRRAARICLILSEETRRMGKMKMNSNEDIPVLAPEWDLTGFRRVTARAHWMGVRNTSLYSCCVLLMMMMLCSSAYFSRFFSSELSPLRPRIPPPLPEPIDEERGGYLVNTSACQIPNLSPFDGSVRQYIQPPRPPLCDRGVPPLTYSDLDSVYFVHERQHLYGAKSPLLNVSCCTRDIFLKATRARNNGKHLYESQSVFYSPECRPLTDRYTPEAAGGVEVRCFLEKKQVYQDFYHFVPLRPQLEVARASRRQHQVRPSVLIFVLDSLSRLQFSRWFPKTRRLLKGKLRAFELGGLNKEGDNTFPNFVALLTGMSMSEMEQMCAPNTRRDFLDSCPFVWKDFERAGYRTVLAEDASFMGAFDYLKLGFATQPTDYYTRPTVLLADDKIAHGRSGNTYMCNGKRPMYEWTFKYAQDVASRFWSRPYWALVSQVSYTHDYFTMPYHLDEPFHQMLDTLTSRGVLNNTVLIIMGDHGLRYGAARSTFIGALEERLPLMSIAFPIWMRERYPVAFNNLRLNQRRLTSFRDVYAMMKSLLNADEELASVDEAEAPANASSVNLFRRISGLRTCKDIQVPLHFCTCLSTGLVPASDARAKAAAAAVITHINKLLRAAPQCAQLRLEVIKGARIRDQPSTKAGEKFWAQLITLQLQTQPGEAQFEATVLARRRKYLLSGPVSRLDKYGHLNWCIEDHELEKYCHCESKTDTEDVHPETNDRLEKRPKQSRVKTKAKPQTQNSGSQNVSSKKSKETLRLEHLKSWAKAKAKQRTQKGSPQKVSSIKSKETLRFENLKSWAKAKTKARTQIGSPQNAYSTESKETLRLENLKSWAKAKAKPRTQKGSPQKVSSIKSKEALKLEHLTSRAKAKAKPQTQKGSSQKVSGIKSKEALKLENVKSKAKTKAKPRTLKGSPQKLSGIKSKEALELENVKSRAKAKTKPRTQKGSPQKEISIKSKEALKYENLKSWAKTKAKRTTPKSRLQKNIQYKIK